MPAAEPPRAICSWCGALVRPGRDGPEVSHGICPPCAARELLAWQARRADPPGASRASAAGR